jgi:hypothetical protein
VQVEPKRTPLKINAYVFLYAQLTVQHGTSPACVKDAILFKIHATRSARIRLVVDFILLIEKTHARPIIKEQFIFEKILSMERSSLRIYLLIVDF